MSQLYNNANQIQPQQLSLREEKLNKYRNKNPIVVVHPKADRFSSREENENSIFEMQKNPYNDPTPIIKRIEVNKKRNSNIKAACITLSLIDITIGGSILAVASLCSYIIYANFLTPTQEAGIYLAFVVLLGAFVAGLFCNIHVISHLYKNRKITNSQLFSEESQKNRILNRLAFRAGGAKPNHLQRYDAAVEADIKAANDAAEQLNKKTKEEIEEEAEKERKEKILLDRFNKKTEQEFQNCVEFNKKLNISIPNIDAIPQFQLPESIPVPLPMLPVQSSEELEELEDIQEVV